MIRTLREGRPVVLRNVGTLRPFTKKAQHYKHPTTGEYMTAPPRKHVGFILSPRLRVALKRPTRKRKAG